MSDVFLGQIMMTSFGFAPKGFALCNGQLLPLNQYQALYSLLGVRYGGDGRTSFALPNLQGTTPVGSGPSVDPNWQPSPYVQGTVAGAPSVTLTTQQLPAHTHLANATLTAGSARTPANTLLGAAAAPTYATASNLVPLNPAMVDVTGGSQPHDNMQPYRAINFNIALTGIFPSRN